VERRGKRYSFASQATIRVTKVPIPDKTQPPTLEKIERGTKKSGQWPVVRVERLNIMPPLLSDFL
jgi:hypothetical protein